MPHLVLQHSHNLLEQDFQPFFKHVHNVLENSMNSKVAKCRSRVITSSDNYIGDGDASNAFIHLEIYIKPGSKPDLIKATGLQILELLNNYVANSKSKLALQTSLEFHEVGSYYIN